MNIANRSGRAPGVGRQRPVTILERQQLMPGITAGPLVLVPARRSGAIAERGRSFLLFEDRAR
jgi:hypothetical protein